MMNHFKLKVAGLYIVFLAIYQKYSHPWYWYARNCISWHLCVPDFDAGGIHNANLPVNAFCKYKTGWSKSGWWLLISMVYVVFILWLVLWSRVTHIHLKKKIEYHEKGQYFLSLISEIETHILIDSLHMAWNMLSFYFLKFWWLWLADNENPKFSVSENLNIT